MRHHISARLARHATATTPRVGGRPTPLLTAAVLLLAMIITGMPARAASSQQGQSASSKPEEVVKQTTHQLLAAVEKRRQDLEKHPQQLRSLVAKYVFPHVDLPYASRWVLGSHWHSLSTDQKQRFEHQFRLLLIRTYATAAIQATSAKIRYLPSSTSANGAQAMVRTRVSPTGGGQPLNVDYRLHRTEGTWKVFDIIVDGSSLVVTYRESFAEQIDRHGFQGLLHALVEKNKSASGGSS